MYPFTSPDHRVGFSVVIEVFEQFVSRDFGTAFHDGGDALVLDL
jgi:hypothetical protein